ncbi:hypothetical protein [Microbulbifer sp. TRSA005]|uniref:hypothetical protein n=1 Tax=unclassified Microbulbifer TaxID=2619833 RepID=UPI00403A42F7
MPGVHLNIGGSYPGSRLSEISLSWMVARVTKHPDLILDEKCPPNPDSFESNIRDWLRESIDLESDF